MTAIALTIAGSDPSSGAGLQSDLRTFTKLGVYGVSAVTLITVQNSKQLQRVSCCDPALLEEQLSCLVADINPAAAKTGALGSAAAVAVVAEFANLSGIPLVVDPVIRSSSGMPLLDEEGIAILRKQLLPASLLVTPNLQEAAILAGVAVIDSIEQMKEAARRISAFGVPNVLVTGGHLTGSATDVLLASGSFTVLEEQKIGDSTFDTHGSGCMLSAAITAHLALGQTLVDAVSSAKRWCTKAIAESRQLGEGSRLSI